MANLGMQICICPLMVGVRTCHSEGNRCCDCQKQLPCSEVTNCCNYKVLDRAVIKSPTSLLDAATHPAVCYILQDTAMTTTLRCALLDQGKDSIV